MTTALAVVLTVAFVAVDARAWFLANRNDIEGLWVVMHLFALGGAATMVWGWWGIDRDMERTTTKAKGAKR